MPKQRCELISNSLQTAEDFRAKERPKTGICPNELFHILRRGTKSSSADDFSCGPSKPCSNGACCAKTGYCGYGPDSCGDGNTPNKKCWSNCDAHAECGRYAEDPGEKCPLNVCCSQYGFCGMTPGFCNVTDNANTTCQSNCKQPGSGTSNGDVQSRIIGYYEAWNWNKKCTGMQLKDIPVSSITHLHYAFAYIDPSSYEITTMDNTIPYDLFTGITSLKMQNPNLKVIISLGGWTFSDDNTATQPFVDKLIDFMLNYGFDGVDLDWEYPGASDRGGKEDDGVKYTQLLAALRTKFSGIISFTAPTSCWYLRHFDLTAMTKYVDWINVMTYDLHGTWDNTTAAIGNHVFAHTNLTEIKTAFDLYWRNNIPAEKVNLGLGFYGRSFQLKDPSCFRPGCLFKGGASPGSCTDNSGTLSYREIMDIIDRYNISPYYDKENQVKYITWKSDQWVSYDDQDTFQAKIKFANDLGLGGLLLWSLDQDTPELDGLVAVIHPKTLGSLGAEAVAVNNWQNMTNGDCRVTPCGITGCNTGEVRMTDQRCDGKGHQNSLCCPFASAPDPKTCQWRGTASTCNGQCHPSEVALQSNRWGDGSYCTDGLKFYCCPAINELPICRWTNCGSCFDNHCPTGRSISLTTNYGGEGKDCGSRLERKRSFCCEPEDGRSPFLPVPLNYLFPAPPTGEDVDTTFKLKVDPTYGGSADAIPFSDDPENGEFGFAIITSPAELQVTLDERDGSSWSVFDCNDSKSEEAQTVRMMCTDESEHGDCHKIHLGHGATGTIIEMPRGCGPGKYAVVKSMELSRNQNPPDHLVKRGVVVSTIYDLTFDYDFSRVPRDLGSTQMRIDVSNEPGYWDKVVDKAASKRKVKRDLSQHDGNHRRWLEDAWQEDKRDFGQNHNELHRRWFGSDVVTWLKGLLNGVDDIDVPFIANSYVDDFTVVLLDETFPDCPIGPKGTLVNGKLKVKATTHVDIQTSFGLTIITDLQNLDFSNSYLYFRNRGADAVAQAKWSSGFGATFSVPGIVTIGPNFVLNAEVKGDITLAAFFEASVNLASWDIRQTYPVQDEEWNPQAHQDPNRDGTQELLAPEFDYGVSAVGAIEAHVMPTISFGITFHKKIAELEATVNLFADGYVRFHAEASTGKAGSSFCYGIDAGADLYATAIAPDFPGWNLPNHQFQLAHVDPISIVPRTCPIGARDLGYVAGDELNTTMHTLPHSEEHVKSLHSTQSLANLKKRGQIYGPVFSIPKVSCPASGDNNAQPEECLICQKSDDINLIGRRDEGGSCLLIQGNPDESTCTDSIISRDLGWTDNYLSKNDTEAGFEHVHPYPSCGEAAQKPGVSRWWGFESDDTRKSTCPTKITKFSKNQIDPSQYQTDHLLDTQVILRFLDMLRGGTQFGTVLPRNYQPASNEWVSGVLMGFPFTNVHTHPVNGKPFLFADLGADIGAFRSINGAKGTWFGLKTPAAVKKGLRESKIFQRDAAGVFQYMQQSVIWDRFIGAAGNVEDSLDVFDTTYTWPPNVAQGGIGLGLPTRASGEPRAGLRDLWCYYIDTLLSTIEISASTWSRQAREMAQKDPMFAGTEGQKWIEAFFASGSIADPTRMVFPHPNPAANPAARGVIIRQSRFGAWDSAYPAGPWT
ncbi:glycoside hydrolase family 18 protein [Polychaeton citri CBS 116435]|uniref:chitinase n=1 Tax=Polychaeton citri CBS 116435 TaxID=1314669 RepID=A0A9P4PXC7_9PEZI|nr:glycoside hydrolase family 18 protein [Polychaeton citri CBS 116435]